MSTLTPNYGLIVPDGADTVEQVRADYATNLNTIDGIGGGGSGGHTIIDENGNSLPQESGLQFTGGVTVTDDSVNGKTVVDISGGGGNVYGAFIDTDRVIVPDTAFRSSLSYTAVEDCVICLYLVNKGNASTMLEIDGKWIQNYWQSSMVTTASAPIFLKKGQTFTVSGAESNYDSAYHVYGIKQGTSGIFAPVIYSDTERVVGVWRDNKPLYQKTISVSPLPNSGTKEIQLDNDIEKIISMNGYAIDGNDKWDIFFNDVVPTNNNASIRVYTNTTTKKLYITTAVDLRSYTEAYITLQYTKTTDVAGSGNWNTDGVPTVHYSTSEQVIGTWENGKPLYRRIFTTNTMNISTSAGALYSGSVAIGDYIPDVDQIFVDIGKTYVNVSGVTKGLISASQEGSVIAVYSIVSRSNCTITFTVDYTKVTD